MTHAELAQALELSRPQISRDVAKGMPLDVQGAKKWRNENKLVRINKSGPKPKIESESAEYEPESDDLLLVLEIASELPSLATNEKERKVLARAEKYVTEEVRILINTR